MPLRMRPATLSVPDRSVAKVPPKSADPFYHTSDWRTLRLKVLQRDGFRCTAPGCQAKATFVDHIISRRAGGRDVPENLRSLCAEHDARVKEDHTGRRRNGGHFETKR